MTTRTITTVLAAPGLLILSTTATVADAADEVRELFASLYGPKIKQVIRTGDKSDDIALASEMLGVARQSTTPKQLALVLADEAYKLAARDVSGLDVAAEALGIVARQDPRQRGGILDKLILLRNREYRGARGEERSVAGEKLLDAYEAAADFKMKSDDVDGALRHLRRALGVARGFGSPRRAELQQRIDAIATEQRAAGRIATLKDRVKAGDRSAGQDLLELYVIDLDRPEEARKYTFLAGDAAWKTNVRLASKEPSSLEAGEALALGDWYRSLATTVALASSKPAMYTRAHRYYAFALTQGLEGTAKLKATLGLSAVDSALKSLDVDPASIAKIPVGAGPTVTVPPGEIDLLASVDPSKDVVEGRWALAQGKLTCGAAKFARIHTGVIPQGDYRVQFKFAPSSFTGPSLFVPVAGRHATLKIGGESNGYSALEWINGRHAYAPDNPTRTRSFKIKPGSVHAAEVTVRVAGASAKIEATVDGRPLVKWSGPVAAITVYPAWKMRDQRVVAFGFHETVAAIREAKLTMLSGEARSLRGDLVAGSPEPARPGALDSAGAIDLLALVEPDRDAVKGKWSRDAEGVLTPERGARMRAVLPVKASGSYDLSVKMSRPEGKEAVVIYLPVGDRSCQFVMSGHWGGTRAGFMELHDVGVENNTATVPHTVKSGRIYRVKLSVRVDGPKTTLSAEADGKPLVSWSGPTKALRTRVDWHLSDQHVFGLGVYDDPWRFFEIKLKVLDGEARHVRTGAVLAAGKTSRSENLVTRVDPDRDAVRRQWSRNREELQVLRAPGTALLAIPARPRGDYRYEIEFTRTEGNTDVVAMFPVGKEQMSVVLSGRWGEFSGLGPISNGENRWKGMRVVRPGELKNGHRYSLLIDVKTKGEGAHIDVQLDRKPYLRYDGPLSWLSTSTKWTTGKVQGIYTLGLGAEGGTAVTFHGLKLVRGDGRRGRSLR